MRYSYRTKGTCSYRIEFDYDDGVVHNVSFAGGCNGNLKAVSALVEGLPPDEIVKKLKGITCGFRKTSCADQLAEAVLEAIKEKGE
ncbi:MAG TPA: TIGR03905 family TSCPD domain-containing protein [Clostridia bacterium]|jgi:uncharacterized protein (TIGR03905 family)|nr:TIGR03905 family TSCPD domain-containing protein [Clostridia bacterium]HOK82162.1 TIGR03905 family TSCPD domain-containing protein [Clostridia bacterium]HOL61171.1 TIGR03905 family TSCPD domain-containing protein [Clostridia bacterium]HPO53855.1 TIGR03905 family TSCPD domain-containing protein [Clostridia bacterium]